MGGMGRFELDRPRPTIPDVTTALHDRTRADRLMRRALGVEGEAVPGAVFDARNKLRSSIVISGIRCIITYLLVPIVTPIVGFTGVVAAPISIALSVIAIVLGYNSLRRFWLADHRLRWRYTAFIAVVWVLLAVGIVVDLATLVA
jgi:O-antigen/teichoic acid export membrane protein